MESRTNYKKWAFRLLIYLLIVEAVSFYTVVNFFNDIENSDTFHLRVNILWNLSRVLFLLGSVLTILMLTKKENKNYQYYISLIGYPLFLIFSVVLPFL
ncbi:hypothetical protein [uncultured Tenacibaculum sp.]|uniref:hypothetical protein n=1 Tax=uncultured Tenacibaculum sp. TaxID=174713 RepID=UPI0026381959|nr:hypothetical protein [uncultured Tenacibaculum sp.]